MFVDIEESTDFQDEPSEELSIPAIRFFVPLGIYFVGYITDIEAMAM